MCSSSDNKNYICVCEISDASGDIDEGGVSQRFFSGSETRILMNTRANKLIFKNMFKIYKQKKMYKFEILWAKPVLKTLWKF